MGSSSVIDADPEHARLAVLHSYRIVDTPPESQFDEIVRRTAATCGTAAAVLVLVDEKRCWFKARVGLEITEVARDLSLCNHGFRNRGIFIVNDARLDPRYSGLPIVKRDGFNFFAGMPLVTPHGHPLGILCVMDPQPRELSVAQITALKMLSTEVMDLFEQRRVNNQLSASSAKSVPGKAELNGNSGSLLIVDDDDAVRSFVCIATRRLGYHVMEAANGIDALDQFEKNPGKITLVLTDVNMPHMDGVELVKRLKRQPASPGIVVMSGRFDPHVRTALKTEGVTTLLSKPFSTEALKLTLAQALAARA